MPSEPGTGRATVRSVPVLAVVLVVAGAVASLAIWLGTDRRSQTEWAILLGALAVTVVAAALVLVLSNQRRRLDAEVADAVAESEELRLRFQSIFDNGPLGVVLARPDGTIVASNAQMDALLGHPDPPYRTLFDSVDEDEVEQAKLWLGQLVSGARDSLVGERRLRRADGTTCWVRMSIGAARGSDGRAVALVSHIADISGEREERERLRLAEERFRNAFTHATTAMAVLSPDGRYLQVNEALCEIAGRTADELHGMQFLDIRHPDDRAFALAMRDRFLDGRSDVE